MSLILDALRKSEAQRRRGQLPVLSLELPPAAPRPSPARAWWIALPIGVALAAIAIWLVRPADAPEPVAPVEVAERVQPAPAVVVEREPPPVAPLEEADVAPPPVPVAPSTLPETTQPTQQAPPIADASDGAPVIALSDLAAAERRALPPLKLSMHLWSEDPARRFVILDGHRLSEGDRAGNAVVERIEPTGVILAAEGRRIRLPLP